MEQCHRFLHSWQDTEPVSCTDFLRMKSLDITKQLETINWFHTNNILVHSSDPKFTYLSDAKLFSKKHVISGSHPDNLVCERDPLDPQTSDPSDPDCPGHLTHFQPY